MDLGEVLGRVGVPNLVIYLPFSMQVYPQFAIGVIFYAWILLIVEAVEGTAHNIIELCWVDSLSFKPLAVLYEL